MTRNSLPSLSPGRSPVQDFAQGVINAYQKQQEEKHPEIKEPPKTLLRQSKSYRNVKSRYLASQNDAYVKVEQAKNQLKVAPKDSVSSPKFSYPSSPESPDDRGQTRGSPTADSGKANDEFVPKLRYRRVQEMIKFHTKKTQENQLDEEVNHNFKKINRLYKMIHMK